MEARSDDHRRWMRSRERAVQRGRLICDLIGAYMPLAGAVALDAGCGYGGTSIAMCERGADVIAVDRDQTRLSDLTKRCRDIEVQTSELSSLPYPEHSFDLIVLQDVIEHVTDRDETIRELWRVLKPDGLLYLSTPNRTSVLNFFADPHFGLPFVSIKSRSEIQHVLRSRRPSEAGRDDIAELLSLETLTALLERHLFSCQFINTDAARALFERPEDLVWSDFHLHAVDVMRRSKLHRVALRFVNDAPGFFNTWINPTWYLLCRKTGT